MKAETWVAVRVAAAALAVVGGCGRPAGPADGAPAVQGPRRESRTVADYPLVGVVRAVDAKSRLVTIRHEAIPGFMDAMTMPFQVKDPHQLDDVRPGDEVEGTLRVERRGGEVG